MRPFLTLVFKATPVVAEFSKSFLAVMLFLMPKSCLAAALKQSIQTDYGAWFWIDADGMTVCLRHMKRTLFVT